VSSRIPLDKSSESRMINSIPVEHQTHSVFHLNCYLSCNKTIKIIVIYNMAKNENNNTTAATNRSNIRIEFLFIKRFPAKFLNEFNTHIL
jgi:hypothetical protein